MNEVEQNNAGENRWVVRDYGMKQDWDEGGGQSERKGVQWKPIKAPLMITDALFLLEDVDAHAT